MNKILGVLILLLLAVTPAAAVDHTPYWKALASDGESGQHFFLALPFGTKEEAIAAALAKCKQHDGSACEEVVAVPNDHYLVGVLCSNGYDSSYHVGGATHDPTKVFDKIVEADGWFDPENCWIAMQSNPLPGIPDYGDE